MAAPGVLGYRIAMINRPSIPAFLLILAIGSAVACGDDEEGGGGGKGGTAGESGASGTSGASGDSGTGGQGGTAGTSGASGASGSSGRGGSAGQGGTSGTAGDGGDGGQPGGAGPGGQGGEGGSGVQACNNLPESTSPAIAEVQRSGSLPTPQGGSIDPGTYHLTSWEVYPPATADTANSRSITLLITSGHVEVVGHEDAGEIPRLSADVATSGSTITLTHTCPDTTVDQTNYTATQGAGAQLRLIRTDASRSRVETFTKD